MVSGEVRVRNSSGFHARPASILVRTASGFPCDIILKYKDKSINAKDIMQVMTAGIKYGTNLVIMCEGRGEAEALQAMIRVIENGRLGE